MNMKKLSQRVVYVDELSDEFRQRADVLLRTGSAGCIFATDDGGFGNDVRLHLSPNSTHALLGHGVVEALNKLPLQGRVGTGMDVLIPPSELEPARQIFYRADIKTYGASYEFVIDDQRQVEYRIHIDNREYQNSLSGLQYLLRTASHNGMAVWLRI